MLVTIAQAERLGFAFAGIIEKGDLQPERMNTGPTVVRRYVQNAFAAVLAASTIHHLIEMISFMMQMLV